jgi:quercetin dioxygenase-like cupin family protein
MKRKQFIWTTVAALPALALPGSFAFNATAHESAHESFIVRAGNNRSGKPMMKFMGMHPNDVVISGKDTNNEMSVFLFDGYGPASTPLHVHFHQDEFFTVMEGKYRFVCGESTNELNAGDTIFLPRNIPHQWLQLSDRGKLIYAVNPAGELEEFFRALDNLKEPTPDVMDQIAIQHGMEFLGPPLSR